MSIDKVQRILGWPRVDHILHPPGAGAKICLELARNKLEYSLKRCPDGDSARVGILTLDPQSTSTQSPLAIVCEFGLRVSRETLDYAHKLAWNFCRAPLLITIEPHLLRAYSCYEPPSAQSDLESDAGLKEIRLSLSDGVILSLQV